MKFILELWRQFRLLIVFLILEGASLYMLFYFNSYQNSFVFSISSKVRENVFETFSLIDDYVSMPDKNLALANSNAVLIEKLNNIKNISDTLSNVRQRYHAIPAKVIHYTTNNPDNYIIVNKGSQDGIKTEMAVVSSMGLVGIVYAVSDNYAFILPIINTSFSCLVSVGQYTISANTVWKGDDYGYIHVTEMPLHLKINEGDSVFTNNNSALYPKGELIGIVKNVTKEHLGKFNALKVRLATDFSKLHYLYVLEDKDKSEIDSLLNDK